MIKKAFHASEYTKDYIIYLPWYTISFGETGSQFKPFVLLVIGKHSVIKIRMFVQTRLLHYTCLHLLKGLIIKIT